MNFAFQMKKNLLIIIGIIMWLPAYQQNMDELQLDNLNQALANAKADSTRALVLTQLSELYRFSNPDSSYRYGQEALSLSRSINYPSGEAKALSALSHYYFSHGELPNGLELGLQALRIAKKHGLKYDQASSLIRIANVYANLRDYEKALVYYHQAIALTKDSNDPFFHAAAHWRAGDAYARLNEIDSAIFYCKKAEDMAKKMGNQFIQHGVIPTLGYAYAKKGDDSLALRYLNSGRGYSTLLMRALFFRDREQYDSSLYYANIVFERSLQNKDKDTEVFAATLLSELNESKDPSNSLKYLKIAVAAKESMYGAARVLSAKSIEFEEQELENERRLEEMAIRNKVRISVILGGLLFALLIATILFRNYRRVQRVNVQLKQQKSELNQALADLKQTQSQLIQSEKMASLGELTAGIAHEIQNPLNFVNNFSEVSDELIDEMKTELAAGNLQLAVEIADDLKKNLEKILHHGRRADAIVKSMLQHSRTSTGRKELTDLNALCDEYLRLAYHGYRAKDKSFSARFETNFDDSLPHVKVVQQDMGRVILNLINNAFYAVNERFRQAQPDSRYEPMVTVSTKRLSPAGGDRGEEKIQISIKDNGFGIPEDVRERIFQPFYTTKPTGQGTGLGLSLSYDIVTKGHNGHLELATGDDGSGAEFIIILPIN